MADYRNRTVGSAQPVKLFQDLISNSDLLKGVQLQFEVPNEVQSAMVPLVKDNDKEDILVYSRPRSGKTISAIIGILERVIRDKDKAKKGLIICPTLELARKAYNYAVSFTEFCPNIKIRRAIEEDKISQITEDLVIGTSSKIAEFGKELIKIELVGINEANCIAEQKGHRKRMKMICEHLSRRRQFILCCTSHSKDLKAFAGSISEYWDVREFPWKRPNVDIKYFVFKEKEEKMDIILKIEHSSSYPGQTIIFSNEKYLCDKICKTMCENGKIAAVLHGTQKFKDRDQILNRFKEETLEVLVTNSSFTNVISNSGLSKIFNIDHLVKENEDHQLDVPAYMRRESLMFGKQKGLILSFIDKGWEEFLLQGIPRKDITYSEKIA